MGVTRVRSRPDSRAPLPLRGEGQGGGSMNDRGSNNETSAVADRGLDRMVKKSRQRPTLPPGYPGSTIGAGGLNGRVRNGNGCDPSAMVTGMNLSKIERSRPEQVLPRALHSMTTTEDPLRRHGHRSVRFRQYKRYGQASRPISTR